MTATAGFLLASQGSIDLWLLVDVLAGISLVIASACVFNNFIDRDIDIKMKRTKQRATVTGLIPGRQAIIFATLLGLGGYLTLILGTNLLTTYLGLIAFVDYVVIYGVMKRKSVYGTIIGSVGGAMPLVAGYTSVTDRLDMAAALLFLIMVFWQMAHFYAIGIYRLKDYTAALIPILPVKSGPHLTKLNIIFYIVAFTITSAMLSVTGYTGYVYLATVVALGLTWCWLGLKGFKSDNDQLWARKMFLFSLIVITAFSLAVSVDATLNLN